MAGPTWSQGDIMIQPSGVFPADLSCWYQADKPWDSGFISLMRAMAARHPGLPPQGTALLPSQEPYRLGQVASMIFPPREIATLMEEGQQLKIALYSLGVWGPNSVLPLHLSELAYVHTSRQEEGLNDFTDIFHHRALSQFYRAWFLCQDTATLDNPKDELFSFYIGSLSGFDAQEIAPHPLPVHARLASAPHFIREARNPSGLLDSLRHYFGLPMQLQEFTLQWISLTAADQTRLGHPRSACRLGDGAILGDTVPDIQHKFQLVLGPLTLPQYLSFTPWGPDMPVLREWVRSFTGVEYSWDVRLLLAADQVPLADLSGAHQIGYAAWLERQPSEAPVAGMCFEPENIVTY